MNRTQYSLVIAAAIIFSMIGGALSTHLFTANPIHAAEIKLKGQGKGPTTNIIKAQRFELVDAQGKACAVLSRRADGTPQLVLLDKKGSVSFGLELGPKGHPTMTFTGEGAGQAVLAVWPDKTPGLVLSDKQGNVRGTFRLSPAGKPALIFADEKGNPRAVLGRVSPETIAARVPSRPVASLVLYDQKRNVIWKTP